MTATVSANGLLQKPAYNDPLWDVQVNQNWTNIDAALHGRNLLINSEFMIDQVNSGISTAISDDTYAMDVWNVLTQTASVAAIRVANPENGYRNGIKLTQSQATAQRFGFSQIIEGVRSNFLRGDSGVLSGRIKCSAATPIRYAILSWTGAEDVVISDVVASWTNGTFTAGQFFNSTTLTVVAVGSITPLAATWTPLTALTGAMGTGITNAIIFMWTETAQAQNVTLECDSLQFEAGAVPSRFERRLYTQEVANVQRHVWIVSRTLNQLFPFCGASENATHAYVAVPNPVLMLKIPVFSTVGNFKVYEADVGTAATGITGQTLSSDASVLDATVAAGLTGGRSAIIQANSATSTMIFDGRL